MTMPENWIETTRQFHESAKPWLTEEDTASVAALYLVAKAIDEATGSPAPLIAQWGLMHRNLLKSRSAAPEVDPLEEILRG